MGDPAVQRGAVWWGQAHPRGPRCLQAAGTSPGQFTGQRGHGKGVLLSPHTHSVQPPREPPSAVLFAPGLVALGSHCCPGVRALECLLPRTAAPELPGAPVQTAVGRSPGRASGSRERSAAVPAAAPGRVLGGPWDHSLAPRCPQAAVQQADGLTSLCVYSNRPGRG